MHVIVSLCFTINLDPNSRPKFFTYTMFSDQYCRQELKYIHNCATSSIDWKIPSRLCTQVTLQPFRLHGPIAEWRSQCSISQLHDGMTHGRARTNNTGIAANTCQSWLCLPCVVLRAYWPYFKDKINMCAAVVQCFSLCLFHHLISKIIQLNHPKQDGVSSNWIKPAAYWIN